MARRGSRPTHFIAVTAKVGKRKYEKGPYIGLWEGDDDRGPMFRGSVSGKYLDELYDFIKDYGEDSVSFAVFESRGKSNRRNRDEDEEDQPPRGKRRRSRDDDDDRGSSKRRGKREEEEEEEEEEEKRGSRRGGSRGKKKADPWED